MTNEPSFSASSKPRAGQPQRGCVLQPRVGAAPTLGNRGHEDVNPERVVAWSRPRGNERRNPVGVDEPVSISQGRRWAPSLGWRTQPRWGRSAEYTGLGQAIHWSV